MLFLWVFGNNIEDRLGRIRFLPFYLLCGMIAGLAQALTDTQTDVPLIGASGAIAGVLGAYIVLYPRARVWTWIFPIFVLPLPGLPAARVLVRLPVPLRLRAWPRWGAAWPTGRTSPVSWPGRS